jgi:DNA repair protein REV1
MFMSKAKELCPELVVMHYDFQQYESVSEQVPLSTSLSTFVTLCQIYRIFFTVADILQLPTERVIVQPVSVDEAYLEIISVGNRQIDGLAVAALIRQRIWDDTRCPSSAGVGDNMLLARLATKKVSSYLSPALTSLLCSRRSRMGSTKSVALLGAMSS